jgi:DNA polymerase III delta prime subunit
MMDLDWGQKYRPKTIDEVIVPKSRRNWLKNLGQQQGGLSMLFWGRAGCGKTTVAKLINPSNTLFINCSTNNSIDTIRWIEETFDCGMVFGGRRVLLLDEADNLTADAQAALRGVAEELSPYNDFILTANDPNKLTEAIRSRFLPVDFDFDETEELIDYICARMHQIAFLEGYVEVDSGLIRDIVEKRFPDIRRITKTLQHELMNQENSYESF